MFVSADHSTCMMCMQIIIKRGTAIGITRNAACSCACSIMVLACMHMYQ